MNRFPPSSFYHWAEPVNGRSDLKSGEFALTQSPIELRVLCVSVVDHILCALRLTSVPSLPVVYSMPRFLKDSSIALSTFLRT
jgi:hypothetical protein